MIVGVSAVFAQSPVCLSEDIVKIPRILKLKNGDRQIDYLFRYLPAQNPNAPVVIQIPGGPGAGSIGNMDPRHGLDYGHIQIDPRGVGCNDMSLPAEALTSELLAEDILAIIKDLKIKKYILYGTSYGTLVATLAAHKAASLGLPQPMSLVLDSTLGRASSPQDRSQEFSQSWDRIRKDLNPQVAQQFDDTDNLPLGLTAQAWGQWIMTMITFNTTSNDENVLKTQLENGQYGWDNQEKLRKAVGASMKSGPNQSSNAENVFKHIACREIRNPIDYETWMIKGRLENVQVTDVCQGLSFDRKFDAGLWPVRAPIYYFVGLQDPSTPLAQTKYHLKSQTKAKRTLIEVSNAAHAVLSTALSNCSIQIWSAILKGQANLKNDLKFCNYKTKVTIHGGGE